MRQKWTKLVANCVNAVYAIANVQIERVWVDAALGAFINRVWDEAEAVMARAGVSFDPTTRVPPPGSQPPPSSGAVEYYGSTWDDVALRKGRSEVEWFNGEIVRLAASCGTDAPLNRLLLDVCSDMAAKREAPGRYTVEQLVARANASA
jgi:2-dehydropantoate 2-reductase